MALFQNALARESSGADLIAQHGLVMLHQNEEVASLFFDDKNIRDRVWLDLLHQGQGSGSQPGYTTHDHRLSERPLFEITVEKSFARQLSGEPSFPSERLHNKGQEIPSDDRIINALRAFRSLSPTLQTSGDAPRMITTQGVMALVGENEASVLFRERTLRDQVHGALRRMPGTLANSGTQAPTADHTFGETKIFELKLNREFAMRLMEEPDFNANRKVNRGREIQAGQIMKEALETFGRLNKPTGPAYVPPPFHPKPKPPVSPSEGAAPAPAIVSSAITTDADIPRVKTENPIAERENDSAPPVVKAPPAPIPIPDQPAKTNEEPAMTASAPQARILTSAADEEPAKANTYEVYRQSFGFQLTMRRDEREMTLGQLADAVSTTLKSGMTVAERDVRLWESGRAVPNDQQFEALATVLIEENNRVTDKAKGLEDFRKAYEETKAILSGGSISPADLDKLHAFGDMVASLRDERKLSTEGLAKRTQEKLRFEIPEEESKLFEQDKKTLLAAVEASAYKPSKNFVLALVQGLNGAKPMTDDEKTKFYDAFETGESTYQTRKRAQGEVLPLADTPANDEEMRGDEPVKSQRKARPSDLLTLEQKNDYKRRLKAMLTDEGEGIATSVLAKKIGIHNSPFLALVSEGASMDPMKLGSFSPNSEKLLTAYLRDVKHRTEPQIKEFEDFFNQYRQAYGYTLRAPTPDL